jgi:hypothetical protein
MYYFDSKWIGLCRFWATFSQAHLVTLPRGSPHLNLFPFPAALESTFKAIMGYETPVVQPPSDYRGDFFKGILLALEWEHLKSFKYEALELSLRRYVANCRTNSVVRFYTKS